jgi:alkylation response protein AidB-like acyl-CoA dehydrogenase
MNDTLFAGADAAMLADSVDHFLADHYGFEQRHRRLSKGPTDRGCWPQMAELGWLGLPLPESLGGFGGSWLDVALLMQRFGRALVVEPYLANVVLAGGLLARLGSAQQQARWLAPMIDGACQLALAYAEPGTRHLWTRPRAALRAVGAGWQLDGAKSLVWGGATADGFIVLAHEAGRDDALSLVIVERGARGLGIEPFTAIDGHSGAELRFEAVAVDAAARVGPLRGAQPDVERVLDEAAVLSCCEGIGVMEVLFDATLEYLKQRQQFGRPLASNQALQHRLVDMHTLWRESEAVARYAVSALDADAANRSRAASLAKVHVGQALRQLGQEAVQLHGAIGTTDEYAISHHFKRATALSLLFGDIDLHRARLGRALRDEHASARLATATTAPLTA